MFAVAEFADAFQHADIGLVCVRNELSLVGERRVGDAVAEIPQKQGEVRLVERLFKGRFNQMLGLLFVHT